MTEGQDLGSFAGALWRMGLLDPAAVTALAGASARYGRSTATPYVAAAMRYPNRTAVVDDYGSLTYRQLDRRTGLAATALRAVDVNRGTAIGVLCRNHRGFVEANIAAAKVGARPVLLNTGLAKTQLLEVIDREKITAVIADRDLAEGFEAIQGCRLIVCAPEDDPEWSFPELARRGSPVQVARSALSELSALTLDSPLSPFRRGGSEDPVLLTSGTTGAPKGAKRSTGSTRDAARTSLSAVGFVESIPFARGDVTVLPAPLFHAWGFSQLVLSATLAGTVVLRRRFSPNAVLDDLEAHGGAVLAAVPVMLHRMLDSADDLRAGERDLSSLRLVAVSGSALPGDLAARWMDRFGDTLYNLYGSTEVGQVSVAGPQDLRDAPGTAGRPLRGIGLHLLDDSDQPVGAGETGHIAIDSPMHFDGYTDGRNKRVVDGRMITGDQGHLDEDGRLFIDGRADDMIITGGENVFPSGIEAATLQHPSVGEVAVVGVPDDDLGQRIRAVVVPSQTAAATGAAELTRQIKAHLRAELAQYEIPREYVYVTGLPRTTTGKVRRSELVGPRRSVPNQRKKQQATETTPKTRSTKKARS